MIVNVTAEFNKDISRLRDKKTLLAIKESLTQIETAQSLFEMASVKKLYKARRDITGYGLATTGWDYTSTGLLLQSPAFSTEKRFIDTFRNRDINDYTAS